jgi:hypothetical protein
VQVGGYGGVDVVVVSRVGAEHNTAVVALDSGQHCVALPVRSLHRPRIVLSWFWAGVARSGAAIRVIARLVASSSAGDHVSAVMLGDGQGERAVVVAGSSESVRAAVGRRRRRPRRSDDAGNGRVRFALYGRMSTRGYQDRVTSLGWQRDMAVATIAGRGGIVVEYFDVGCSRRLAWEERPEAAALLAAARGAARPFDAVVVGEYERAFCGDQFLSVIEELSRYGVQVWLPEAGGSVDVRNPVHQALLVLLGAQSRREIVRARRRVRAAMWSQVQVQGRFLGGRPPYGYRLVDAGPHPNAVHAGWGRRLHRLEPDPGTAPWVRWIFAQRAAGRNVAGIARELNERGVPCPSGVDRVRNRHRWGEAWLVRTVVGILENPRYTGRQVWNRHSGSSRDGGAGEWTAPSEWAVSRTRVHEALVDDATFAAVQGMRVARQTEDGRVRS